MDDLKNIFETGQTILINKPYKWTSFDVVKKVRGLIKKYYRLNKIKVGHAGTLDPLAEGLLIVCTGKHTKTISAIQDYEKVYTGTFVLGASTPSYDLETEINETYDYEHITKADILKTKQAFIGKQLQYPPIYSAKKINGKRAYQSAREGLEVELKPSEIQVSKFDITNIALPEIAFSISCSKGTYIRSIANDFGKALNSGAYLSSLSRVSIGNYKLSDAISIENIEDFIVKKIMPEVKKAT